VKWVALNSDTYAQVKSPLLPEKIEALDNYDLGVLSIIIEICLKPTSMADAGRKLFTLAGKKKHR